jgi:hypothetical protein
VFIATISYAQAGILIAAALSIPISGDLAQKKESRIDSPLVSALIAVKLL